MGDVSHGITIVFGTSAFSASITNIKVPEQSRDSVDTSHQGTSDAKTFDPTDLYDAGEFSFDMQFDETESPPITGANETVTVTWPSGTTWSFTGHMTKYGGEAQHLNLMTANATVKISGAISIGSASGGSGS